MIAITRWHWALAIGFWIFLAAVYVAQLLWMAESERIDLGAALTGSSRITQRGCRRRCDLAVYRRLGAGYGGGLAPNRRAARADLCIVLVVVTLVTTAVVFPLVQIPGGPSPSQAFWIKIRGRGYLTLLITPSSPAADPAIFSQDRYREPQTAAAALQHSELSPTARLQALRNHLDPYFLFNSLHSIAALG